MATAHASATVTTDGINLIDEDNAGGISFCLLKKVAHSGSADTDKHFHKFTATDRKERHGGFTGYRLSQQRFPGTRRTDQQYALGDACSQSLEALTILEEIHHFR